jgi:hypothetical protein
MRIDLPQELPQWRTTEGLSTTPPLAPSPIELRREALAARAADRRVTPRVLADRSRRPVRPQDSERRTIAQDCPTDHRVRRDAIPQQAIGLSLRDEEHKLLAEVGRFRVVRTRDLAETVYNNRHSRLERDLAFLREKNLVQVDAVNARRDGRGGKVERIEVVTLTKGGRSLVRSTGGLAHDQKLYAGLVKPREAEHDSQIYRAYRKQAEQIEKSGGTNLRVKLDFELKSEIQKAIYSERKARPQREMNEIKEEVAERFDLPFVDGKIQVPDARIEFDRENKVDDPDQGSRSGHEDIEVLTAAYRPGHLRNKVQAGFHAYASAADRASITAKIEDDHRMMADILEL